MSDEKPRSINEDPPDEFVVSAGPPKMNPQVSDLTFKRDHSAPGILYKADVQDWLPGNNGNGHHRQEIKENK